MRQGVSHMGARSISCDQQPSAGYIVDTMNKIARYHVRHPGLPASLTRLTPSLSSLPLHTHMPTLHRLEQRRPPTNGADGAPVIDRLASLNNQEVGRDVLPRQHLRHLHVSRLGGHHRQRVLVVVLGLLESPLGQSWRPGRQQLLQPLRISLPHRSLRICDQLVELLRQQHRG